MDLTVKTPFDSVGVYAHRRSHVTLDWTDRTKNRLETENTDPFSGANESPLFYLILDRF